MRTNWIGLLMPVFTLACGNSGGAAKPAVFEYVSGTDPQDIHDFETTLTACQGSKDFASAMAAVGSTNIPTTLMRGETVFLIVTRSPTWERDPVLWIDLNDLEAYPSPSGSLEPWKTTRCHVVLHEAVEATIYRTSRPQPTSNDAQVGNRTAYTRRADAAWATPHDRGISAENDLRKAEAAGVTRLYRCNDNNGTPNLVFVVMTSSVAPTRRSEILAHDGSDISGIRYTIGDECATRSLPTVK